MKYTRHHWRVLAAALTLGATGCSSDGTDDGMSTRSSIVSAEDPSTILGTVTFREEGDRGVVADFNIPGNAVISGGQHAIHIHENGSCEAADTDGDGEPEPAGAAGGHYNPTNVGHGEDNGPHAGDSENYNYEFNQEGGFVGEARFPMVTFVDENPLLIDGGTAIIIHAGTDDKTTDPDGNAGPRVACGVIAS